MFLVGHLSEVLFGSDLLGVLFEGSEGLLQQFLRVVGRDDRFIRVHSLVALAMTQRMVRCAFSSRLIRAARAVLQQLSLAEGEARKFACRPHLVQISVQVVTKGLVQEATHLPKFLLSLNFEH